MDLWHARNLRCRLSNFGADALSQARRLPSNWGWWCGDVAALAPSELSLSATAQIAWALIATGSLGTIGRALDAGDRMQAHHPKEPHLYLFTLGTRLASRGKGIGKALLAPVLAECDRTGTSVYLENSNPGNEGFYRSHGFESQGYFPCGKDRVDQKAPLLQKMWRAPKAPGA